MRRHARSEKRQKILRRVRGGREEEEGAGATEIGSWVFPFLTPPPAPASMPTIGTRRSTRVFVPKQQQRSSPVDGDAALILRSEKRFTLSMAKEDDGTDWLKALCCVDVDESDLNRWLKDEEQDGWKEESVVIEKGIEEKKLFGTVYSRKRRRSTSNDVKDRRFGIVFRRKQRWKEQKARPLVERVSKQAPIVCDSSKVSNQGLYSECLDCNTQDICVKVILVPGVREVSGYEDDAVPSFIRPDIYIHMIDNEVGRALASESSFYDMDSADEEWLRHLNSNSSDSQDGGSSYVSEENFERIIFGLEKDAYRAPDDPCDKERALGLCQELGSRDMVSAIYDYWLKKRKQKRGAFLARVFQGPPTLRRTQLIQKPFLRKKQSFKRQRSQAERNQGEWNQGGRGKPDLFLQGFRQQAIRKVQEAEAAASRVAEIATQLRTRAQTLMSNVDLATNKAAMALRIAETLRASSSSLESPDMESSILFD